MHEATVTMVLEADIEVEARIYAGLLREEGVPAQVRVLEDPFLTNVVRQIALPRYQVVVPNAYAVLAAQVVTAHRRTVEESSPDAIEEPLRHEVEDILAANSEHLPSPTMNKRPLILIGRLLIWLAILVGLLLIIVSLADK